MKTFNDKIMHLIIKHRMENNLNLAVLPTVGTYENQMTFQRRIFSRILAAANVVANRGRRGPANFVV